MNEIENRNGNKKKLCRNNCIWEKVSGAHLKWCSCENFESGLKMRAGSMRERNICWHLNFYKCWLTERNRKIEREKNLNKNTATVHYRFDRSYAIGIGTAGRFRQLPCTASYAIISRVRVNVRACFVPCVSFCTSLFKWMLTIPFPSIYSSVPLSRSFHRIFFGLPFDAILIKIERAWACFLG